MSQAGDEALEATWLSQHDHIMTMWNNGKLSMIPGDVDATSVGENLWEDLSNLQSDDDADSSNGDEDEAAGLMHGFDLEEIRASVDPETSILE